MTAELVVAVGADDDWESRLFWAMPHPEDTTPQRLVLDAGGRRPEAFTKSVAHLLSIPEIVVRAATARGMEGWTFNLNAALLGAAIAAAQREEEARKLAEARDAYNDPAVVARWNAGFASW